MDRAATKEKGTITRKIAENGIKQQFQGQSLM
jgi:hypothetical protein